MVKSSSGKIEFCTSEPLVAALPACAFGYGSNEESATQKNSTGNIRATDNNMWLTSPRRRPPDEPCQQQSIRDNTGKAMQNTLKRRSGHSVECLAKIMVTILLFLLTPHSTMGAENRPSFAQVEAVVSDYFSSLKDHQNGDIISKRDVQQIFGQLEALGWSVPEKADILKRVLDDQHYIVKTLRSPKGRKFMRKVSGETLAYDQLDLSSTMPGGKHLITDLLRSPGAERLFRKGNNVGFQNLARQIPPSKRSGTPRPQDFSKPTGRIYTANDLLKALKKSHQQSK
jgi:hypothetical protein